MALLKSVAASASAGTKGEAQERKLAAEVMHEVVAETALTNMINDGAQLTLLKQAEREGAHCALQGSSPPSSMPSIGDSTQAVNQPQSAPAAEQAGAVKAEKQGEDFWWQEVVEESHSHSVRAAQALALAENGDWSQSSTRMMHALTHVQPLVAVHAWVVDCV